MRAFMVLALLLILCAMK